MEFPPKRALRSAEILYLLLITTGPFLQHVHVNSVRVKKPIYSIFAMVNSIDKVDVGLKRGANAVQLDVELMPNGTATAVHFGYPHCNCLPIECQREQEFGRTLEYIRDSTHGDTSKFGKQLCLVVLHLKTWSVQPDKRYNAGAFIAHSIIRHLWYSVPHWNALNVLVSVAFAKDINIIRGVKDTVAKDMPLLINKIGYDARLEPDLEKIRHMYRQLGLPGPYWQGDGGATCKTIQTDSARLQTYLDERDTESNDRYAAKVYHWVIDRAKEMKRSLERGVDAIITNRPGRLRRVLNSVFNNSHRLATVDDDPWNWFDGWAPFLRMPSTTTSQLGDNNLKIVDDVND